MIFKKIDYLLDLPARCVQGSWLNRLASLRLLGLIPRLDFIHFGSKPGDPVAAG
jgi:hypothetical protein